MSDGAGVVDRETRRALALDALAAILPADRRNRLAIVLSDDDVATLRHLVKRGVGDNTLRALASDIAYLEAWCRAAIGAALPWPAPESLVLKFVAHHLWDPAERAADPEHGMPEEVASRLRVDGVLRKDGPHAPQTVQRRLASWSTLHRWKGLDGPFSSPSLKTAMRLAVRAADRVRRRKSATAVTRDVLDAMLATCSTTSLVDLRDWAILLVGFASGGRRRSELADLRVERLRDEAPVPVDPNDPASERLPCLTIRLGRTKTSSADDDRFAVIAGPPVEALKVWLAAARIEAGPVFRGIDRWGNLDGKGLSAQTVNAIVKRRAALAGI
ncbi:MAG: integrase, partial [Phyllobacteriaceae bacterium]|nr:integrase [Phyllobacteriaceae bacterium]